MIEEVILSNSQRGMNDLAPYLDEAFCFSASKALLQCRRGVVLILTGFYVKGYAETDGPPGAYFLAKALRNLHFTPIIVTDSYCEEFFQGKGEHGTLLMPIDEKNPEEFCANVLKKYNPVCMISVERCGRTVQNRYLNMRGVDITANTAPIDTFFQMAEGIVTIGIGDGGNEIGMGNLYETIEKRLSIAPSIIKTDHLIVATTSNWGAYGLLSYLEKSTGLSLLPEYTEVHAYQEQLVSLGAVDGVTGSHEATVDGFEQETEREVLNRLHELLADNSGPQMQMSEDYDIHSLSQLDIGIQLISIAKDHIVKKKINNCNLLDVGCGTGNLTNILHEQLKYRNIKVYGMDIDEEAIEKANRNFPEIDFFVNDIYTTRNNEKKYRLLISNETLHWMPKLASEFLETTGLIYYFFPEDKEQQYRKWALTHFESSLTNIYNLLEKNGMAFLQFGRDGQLRLLYRILNDTLTKYFPTYQRLIEFPLYYPTDGEISSILDSIGFNIVEKKFFSELLYEKNPVDIINFISGFTKPYLNRIMGKENTDEFYKCIEEIFFSKPHLLASEKLWNRTTLVLTK